MDKAPNSHHDASKKSTRNDEIKASTTNFHDSTMQPSEDHH